MVFTVCSRTSNKILAELVHTDEPQLVSWMMSLKSIVLGIESRKEVCLK